MTIVNQLRHSALFPVVLLACGVGSMSVSAAMPDPKG